MFQTLRWNQIDSDGPGENPSLTISPSLCLCTHIQSQDYLSLSVCISLSRPKFNSKKREDVWKSLCTSNEVTGCNIMCWDFCYLLFFLVFFSSPFTSLEGECFSILYSGEFNASRIVHCRSGYCLSLQYCFPILKTGSFLSSPDLKMTSAAVHTVQTWVCLLSRSNRLQSSVTVSPSWAFFFLHF